VGRTWLATCAAAGGIALVVFALGLPRAEAPAPSRPSLTNQAAPGASPRPGASPARHAPAAPSAALELDPRALHGVYAVSTRHRLELGEATLLELSAAGRLDLSVEADDAGYRLAQRYRFSEREATPGAPGFPDELSLVAEVDPRGALRRLGLPQGDAAARNLARTLWAAVAVRWPEGEPEWSHPATPAHARGEDRFALGPDGARLTRTRTLTSLPDGSPLDGRGELELRLLDGRLTALSGVERTRIATPQGELLATTEVHLTRTGDDPAAVTLALEWEQQPAFEAAPAVEVPARDAPTLVQALERAVRVGPERAVPALFDELARRLAAHPDEVALVLQALRDGGLPHAAQCALVDALGASATAEAQRGLLELLDEDRPRLLGNLYLALGDQAAPLPETTDRLADDALIADGALSPWARTAAGIQIARAEPRWAKTQLRTSLLASLDAGAPRREVLEALAQSGDPVVLDLLGDDERSPDPGTRAAAAEALRNVRGPEADRRLLALSADDAPAVQRAALDALGLRPASSAAVDRARSALVDPALHADAHRALGAWAHDPHTPAGLQARLLELLRATQPCGCAVLVPEGGPQ